MNIVANSILISGFGSHVNAVRAMLEYLGGFNQAAGLGRCSGWDTQNGYAPLYEGQKNHERYTDEQLLLTVMLNLHTAHDPEYWGNELVKLTPNFGRRRAPAWQYKTANKNSPRALDISFNDDYVVITRYDPFYEGSKMIAQLEAAAEQYGAQIRFFVDSKK